MKSISPSKHPFVYAFSFIDAPISYCIFTFLPSIYTIPKCITSKSKYLIVPRPCHRQSVSSNISDSNAADKVQSHDFWPPPIAASLVKNRIMPSALFYIFLGKLSNKACFKTLQCRSSVNPKVRSPHAVQRSLANRSTLCLTITNDCSFLPLWDKPLFDNSSTWPCEYHARKSLALSFSSRWTKNYNLSITLCMPYTRYSNEPKEKL